MIVRSTSSTADGPSSTIASAEAIACWNSGKWHTPSTLCAGSGCSLSLQPAEQGERALGADQELGHVVTGRAHPVEIVAADPPQHLGKVPGDRIRLALGEGAHLLDQAQIAAVLRHALEIAWHFGETDRLAVGEQRVDREQIVDHDAVADRAGAAGVVGGHAAQRRARAGRDVDREEQPVRLQEAVQPIEHEPRLDPDGALPGVELEHPIEVLRVVDHQAGADRLAGLGRAAAARDHRQRPPRARPRARPGRRHRILGTTTPIGSI